MTHCVCVCVCAGARARNPFEDGTTKKKKTRCARPARRVRFYCRIEKFHERAANTYVHPCVCVCHASMKRKIIIIRISYATQVAAGGVYRTALVVQRAYVGPADRRQPQCFTRAPFDDFEWPRRVYSTTTTTRVLSLARKPRAPAAAGNRQRDIGHRPATDISCFQ